MSINSAVIDFPPVKFVHVSQLEEKIKEGIEALYKQWKRARETAFEEILTGENEKQDYADLQTFITEDEIEWIIGTGICSKNRLHKWILIASSVGDWSITFSESVYQPKERANTTRFTGVISSKDRKVQAIPFTYHRHKRYLTPKRDE